jgi:GFO/IDH/MocA oxidoreductase family protein
VDWTAFLGDAPKHDFAPERFLNWTRYWDYSTGIAGDLLFRRHAPLMMALGLGIPERVAAAGGVYDVEGGELPDSLVVSLHYAEGLRIALTSAPDSERAAVIRGDAGSIDIHNEALHVTTDDGSREKIEVAAEEPSHVADWLRCVRNRARCSCDPDSAYPVMVALEMAVRAYRERKTFAWDAAKERVIEAPARA